MRIAVVGSGVSGLVTSYILSQEHDVEMFESGNYIGGHVNTIGVEESGHQLPIDTGFIVYNDKTYPNFIQLLKQLNVQTQPTSMSFSVSDPVTDIEYASNLGGLFARTKNLVDMRFLGMLKEKFRFDRIAKEMLLDEADRLGDMTLQDFLNIHNFNESFARLYILPMTAAVWSAPLDVAAKYPALALLTFLNNHGLLGVNDAPQWRVITGGSSVYVEKLLNVFQRNGGIVHKNTPVTSVLRKNESVAVSYRQNDIEETQHFDHIVMACHSDDALALLADPSADEKSVLSAIPYQYNEAVLHTDISMLPKRKKAWASWNYQLTDEQQPLSMLTYNMNRLQNIDSDNAYCVTLNQTDKINPNKIIRKIDYRHPVYTKESVAAQQRWNDISGLDKRTHYCGAYWFSGFHEDGTRSAVRVCDDFGLSLSGVVPAEAA